MTSPLIWVPKKVTSDVDFTPHIKQVISRTYSESPDNYSDELAQLNRSRQDALRGSAGSDLTARDLLYKYFGQLELLELRFPDLRVPFPWKDAFTSVQISQLSLAYEKASVIFNIGSTLSSLGASSPRSSPEGLKRAFLSFRCASGMFTYINDNFLHAPSTDLSRDVVKVLVGLMGAQATEVFIETMPAATGAGLRSKMCAQAAGLYGAIVEEVKEWVGKGVFIKEWSLLVQVKAKYFSSLSQYHRSLHDTSQSSYGSALARLSIAESSAKETHRLSQLFSSSFSSSALTSLTPDAPSSLLEITKTHLALITDLKLKSQKDNDLIYHAIIPTESSLPAIDKGKPVATPIPIHDVYATPEVQKIVGPDLFAKLVPLSVIESSSLYSEEKAKLVRGEQEKVDLIDTELNTALEFMGLPASLDRFRNRGAGNAEGDVGPQVRNWSEEIRVDELGSGEGRVEELLTKLGGVRERVKKELNSIEMNLIEEERDCEVSRSRFGHLWTQVPSSSLTKSFRSDLNSHKSSLDLAFESDFKAERIWEDIKFDVRVLVNNGGELERVFTDALAGVGQGGAGNGKSLLDFDQADEEEDLTGKRVEIISDHLAKLNRIKKERLEILKDLKERVQNDDISHLLILNRKGSTSIEPTLFASELEKFRPHQTRITQTQSHQQSFLSEISKNFKLLTESKKSKDLFLRYNEIDRKKKELIGRFGRVRESYREVREGVLRGIGFYGDLEMLVDGLKDQTGGFLGGRQAERDRLVGEATIQQRLEGPTTTGQNSSLDQRLSNLNISQRSPPPPPMPPQPQQNQWQPQQPSAYTSPPPLPSSPYGNLPTSGPFALQQQSQSPPQPPQRPPIQAQYSQSQYSSPAPPPPNQNQYSAPPPQPYSAPTSYSPYPAPQRQPSLPPPPPKPASNSSSYLPPPPTPISYSTSTYQPPSNYQSPPPPANNYSNPGYSSQGYQQPPAAQYGYQQPQQPPQQQAQYSQQYGAPPPPLPHQTSYQPQPPQNQLPRY